MWALPPLAGGTYATWGLLAILPLPSLCSPYHAAAFTASHANSIRSNSRAILSAACLGPRFSNSIIMQPASNPGDYDYLVKMLLLGKSGGGGGRQLEGALPSPPNDYCSCNLTEMCGRAGVGKSEMLLRRFAYRERIVDLRANISFKAVDIEGQRVELQVPFMFRSFMFILSLSFHPLNCSRSGTRPAGRVPGQSTLLTMLVLMFS